MTLATRQLSKDDFHLYEEMQTQLDEDYMLRIFDRLTEGDNYLYGLFDNETLIAIAGYTLFAGEFAMLGRLRSDWRYRKKGYGTKIIQYMLEEALKHPTIKWIGANTEQHNKPALAILKKFNIPLVTTLYAAQTDDVSSLLTQQKTWTEVTHLEEKEEWINRTYLNPKFKKTIFPFEAYYPFPAHPSLFENQLEKWRFFENDTQTRYFITWIEEKGNNYLHVVYPWSDFMEQSGFFETIHSEFKSLNDRNEVDLIWMDLDKEEVASLPDDHPFELPSPWLLHGKFIEDLKNQPIENAFSQAKKLISHLEDELDAISSELNEKEKALEESRRMYHHLSDDIEDN